MLVKNKIKYSAFGDKKTLKEWSLDNRCKCDLNNLKRRIQKYGWNILDALKTPITPTKRVKIGIRYGSWIVKSHSNKKSKNGSKCYLCVCDCGTKREVIGQNLTNGGSRGCGCNKAELTKNRFYKGEYTNKRAFYYKYKTKAYKRNLSWNLTWEYFFTITKKNCYYCGVEPLYVFNTPKNKESYIYNGIDRLNNLVGYEPNNCVPCCGKCNLMKLKLSKNDFIDQVNRIYNNFQKTLLDIDNI